MYSLNYSPHLTSTFFVLCDGEGGCPCYLLISVLHTQHLCIPTVPPPQLRVNIVVVTLSIFLLVTSLEAQRGFQRTDKASSKDFRIQLPWGAVDL